LWKALDSNSAPDFVGLFVGTLVAVLEWRLLSRRRSGEQRELVWPVRVRDASQVGTRGSELSADKHHGAVQALS